MDIIYATKPVYKILCNRCAEFVSYDTTLFLYTAEKSCTIKNIELIDQYIDQYDIVPFRKSQIISVRVGVGEIKHSYEDLRMNSGQQLQIEVQTYDPRITENTIKLTIENRNYGE